MQTISCSKARNFLAAATAMIATLGFAAPVFADIMGTAVLNPDGKLTYIGTLGGADSIATGINDAGQVVGYSHTAHYSEHAFITGPNGVGMTDLGTLGGDGSRAFGINNAGQVVGDSDPSRLGYSLHAFITGPNGVGMIDLGTMGGRNSSARGINDAGQVVGFYDTTGGPTHAFITGPDGVGMTDLGTLGGTNSYATGINYAGQVIGYSDMVAGPRHAFITGPNGVGMTDLGMPSGYTGTPAGYTGIANDINNAGQVAGYSHTAEYVFPFITGPNGVEITDLGTLGGTTYSGGSGINDAEHAGINDAGQVVGYSNTSAGPQHAFMTGPNGVGMTDLNSLVSPGSPGLINNAIGINNHGQILVTVSGVPEPETYAMFLAGLALVGFMARLRKTA